MKTLGIVAHSAEGAALCFLTACRESSARLGAYMHPTVVMSAVPMALSMEGWRTGDHSEVAKHLSEGVRRVADAGAHFYVCPDNTAHIVLEKIAMDMPIPGFTSRTSSAARSSRTDGSGSVSSGRSGR